MMILGAIQSFFVAILVGYLSLTNTLADRIQTFLPPVPTKVVSSSSVPSEEPQPASEELTSLSKLFAATEGVTKLLREDDSFQEALSRAGQASVAGAIERAPISKESVLDSLVNILCQYSTDEYTRTTTGTGFFIDTRGVILTNAHVAQFLLLETVDTKVTDAECIIRSGDPATPQYHAELLFISPTWILKNAQLISEEKPRGTGEYDYALLYVSDSLNDTELPATFPALPFHTEYLSKNLTGSTLLTAGYPAEKIFREGARAALTPKIASTTLEEFYTFGSNYADIFSLSASLVGEQGASGGPVVHPEIGAIGLIVTKGEDTSSSTHRLRALTLSYIHRTITEETGFSLLDNTRGDLGHRGEIFKQALVPFLGRLLSFEIAS